MPQNMNRFELFLHVCEPVALGIIWIAVIGALSYWFLLVPAFSKEAPPTRHEEARLFVSQP